MQVKDGIKTTEFWLTVVTVILTALASFGIIGGGEIEELREVVDPLVAAIVPVAMYIYSRARVKSAGR